MSKFYSLVLLTLVVVIAKRGLSKSTFNNRAFGLITLFSFVYFVFVQNDLPRPLVPFWIISFVIGYNVCRNKYALFLILLIFALGNQIHGFLICLTNWGEVYYDEYGGRVLRDIWGGSFRPALEFSVMISAGLCVTLFKSDGKGALLYKMIALFFIFCSIFVSISTATRSAIVYPLIIIIISAIPYIMRRIGRGAITTLIVIIALFFLYSIDLFGVKSFLEDQYLFLRFVEKDGGGVVQNERLDLWKRFFAHIGDFTFGGTFGTAGDRDYVHNVIFDIWVVSGVLSAFLFVSILVRFIKMSLRLFKMIPSFELSQRAFVLGEILSFILIMMTEPAVYAANWFICCLMLYIGGLERCIKETKYNENIIHKYNYIS